MLTFLAEHTGLKVSAKSIPGRCMKPLATRRTLNFTVLSALRVTLKAHLVEMTLDLGAQGSVSLRIRAAGSLSRVSGQAVALRPLRIVWDSSYVVGVGIRLDSNSGEFVVVDGSWRKGGFVGQR